MDDSELTRLFGEALKLSGDEQQRFLAELPSERRTAVTALLRADESAASRGLYDHLINRVHAADEISSGTQVTASGAELGQQSSVPLPKQIGRYKVLELIDEGGMGSVFLAEQTEPVRRRVALKVIKAGMDTAHVIARFEAERQAVAMMDHAHIARVFDAGVTTEGLPYFVMELVRGLAITKYCDEARLNLQQRLGLFVQVCRAIQHAHQKGIIHRDIKPSNILVTQADGFPVPKVIDFGLAKALQPDGLASNTLFTNFGQVLGTLEYMSPEQAEMNTLDIDTRSDVYSLGVLLYELLTGATPLGRERARTEALQQILKLIKEEEAPRPSARLTGSGEAIVCISKQRASEPSKLAGLLNGDLDWITMKALEKDRQRRYDGAAAFADDIERFLNDEPIEARPPSVAYQIGKAYRRHRLAFLSVITAVSLLLAGLVGTAAMWVRAKSAETAARIAASTATRAMRETAEESRKTKDALGEARRERDNVVAAQKKMEAAMATADFRLAVSRWDARLFDDAFKYLKKVPVQHRGLEWRWLRSELEGNSINCLGHVGTVRAVAFSPDGKLLASTSKDKTVRLWNTSTGELVRTIAQDQSVASVAFSPDGALLAFGTPTISLCDSQTGQVIRRLAGHRRLVESLAFNFDGTQLLSGSADSVRVWDTQSGEVIRHFAAEVTGVATGIPIGNLASAVFSPDGEKIAAEGFRRLRWWQVGTGQELKKLQRSGTARGVRFSPDGRSLAWRIMDRVRFCDVDSSELQSVAMPGSSPKGLEFSPDGTQIAALCHDGRVRFWNRQNLVPGKVLGQIGTGDAIAFSPDSRRIACSSGSRIQILPITGAADWSAAMDRGWRLTSSCISPDCRLIAMCGFKYASATNPAGRGLVNLWDTQRREIVKTLSAPDRVIWDICFGADGNHLALPIGTAVQILSILTGESFELHAGKDAVSDRQFEKVAFSPDGRLVAAGGRGHQVTVWNLETRERVQEFPHERGVAELAFSPDSEHLAVATNIELRLWEIQSGECIGVSNKGLAAYSIAFSPDGRQLLSSNGPPSKSPVLWTASGDRMLALEAHPGIVCVAFADRGRRIVTVGGEFIRIADARTGEILTELRHARRLSNAFIGSDDKEVFAVSTDGAIMTWSAEPHSAWKTFEGHLKPVERATFSRDGNYIYSNGLTERFVWNVATGTIVEDAEWVETDSSTSPDGRWLVAHAGKTVLLLDLEQWNSPDAQARRIAEAKSDPQWHNAQAVQAETDKDWFATAFHRAWELKLQPDSRSAAEHLRRAHVELKKSNKSHVPSVVAEAMVIAGSMDSEQ